MLWEGHRAGTSEGSFALAPALTGAGSSLAMAGSRRLHAQWVSAWRAEAALFCGIPAAGGGWAWPAPGRLALQWGEPGRLCFLCPQINKGRATQRGLGLSLLEGGSSSLSFLYPENRLPGLPFAGHQVPRLGAPECQGPC